MFGMSLSQENTYWQRKGVVGQHLKRQLFARMVLKSVFYGSSIRILLPFLRPQFHVNFHFLFTQVKLTFMCFCSAEYECNWIQSMCQGVIRDTIRPSVSELCGLYR